MFRFVFIDDFSEKLSTVSNELIRRGTKNSAKVAESGKIFSQLVKNSVCAMLG